MVRSDTGNNHAKPTKTAQSRTAKVIRRDPEKRREQNRQAQKIYREKQRKRIQELERKAEVAAATETADTAIQSTTEEPQVCSTAAGLPPLLTETSQDLQLISPFQLQASSNPTPQLDEIVWDHDLLPSTFDQWLSNDHSIPPRNEPTLPQTLFFNCGCPTLHLPMHPSPVLLPVIPDIYRNTLHLDRWCLLAAFTENCLQVGITRSMFCADEAISPFYRPKLDSELESNAVVTAVQRVFKTISYDLRPTRAQIVVEHHPYIDAIPFRDIRDNLIDQMDKIDEDEFFHDALNHLICWGGVAGAQTGSPWDSRSWEASEMFLHKWSNIVGGDDGELTRQSRWWRSLRGERITEVF